MTSERRGATLATPRHPDWEPPFREPPFRVILSRAKDLSHLADPGLCFRMVKIPRGARHEMLGMTSQRHPEVKLRDPDHSVSSRLSFVVARIPTKEE